MNSDPQRLLDTEGLGDALRTDLSRAAGHDVGYDVAAGLARFEATLASGGPPPDGGGGGGSGMSGSASASAAGGSAKGLAVVVGLALVVGGGAIAWSLQGGESSRPLVAAAPTPDASEPVDEARVEEPSSDSVDEPKGPDEIEAVLEPAASEAGAPEPAIEEPDASSGSGGEPRAKKPRRSPRRSTGPADDDRLQREMKATDQARQALAGNPARALSLVRKANREFKGGLFGEDREGIAVLALFGLGRDDEARRRAKAFLRAHPRSSYADKIRKAMDKG